MRKTAANYRHTIEDVYNTVSNANATLQQMLPEDRAQTTDKGLSPKL